VVGQKIVLEGAGGELIVDNVEVIACFDDFVALWS
jgi:hypothetical protein